MIQKILLTAVLLAIVTLSYSQFDSYNSYNQLKSLSKEYLQANKLDSAIILYEYAKERFPENQENAIYRLGFLYMQANLDSMAFENWNYGLKKGYYYGLESFYFYDQLKDHSTFRTLVEIDKHNIDSVNKLNHMDYDIVLPSNYSEDILYPLLFVFHGCGRKMDQSKNDWVSKTTTDSFIVVYIQSYIHVSRYFYQWVENDKKTNDEFKLIYKKIIEDYPIDKNHIYLSGMSAGGRIAIEYVFNEFVHASGLILNCPVIPKIPDDLINKFAQKNKKIGIITGENDFALNDQQTLINRLDEIGGETRINITEGMGHEFPNDFSTLLDEYIIWIIK